ncbi:MAG: hypothetical protein GY909_05440 [Oligoflexia bacterium]|nr:hypothetical protein [Oligoflexia bacterium]
MKNILMIVTLLCISSCNEFTEKNLTTAPAIDNKDQGIELLLGQTDKINAGEFSIEKLIANIGIFVVSPQIEKLNEEILDLKSSISQYCSSLATYSELTAEQLNILRKPMQESWKKAVSTFHRIEIMKFGPAAIETSTAQKSIYYFDGEDKCKVDLTLLQVERGRLPRFDIISNYQVRGLDSIEPLLFGEHDKSRCQRRSARIQAYFAKPILEKEKVSCKLMLHNLTDISKKSDELKKEWSPRLKNYSARMLKGQVGAPIEIVNSISQALFVLDTVIKDKKVAFPAGFEIRMDGELKKCNQASCPRNSEHFYSDYALESLIESVKGFKAIFQGIDLNTGIDGFGFDDFLSQRGFSTLANEMVRNSDFVLEKLEMANKSSSFKQLLSEVTIEKCENTRSDNRLAQACAFVWDLRKITDLLKNDYLVALAELSAPRQAQGDND